MKRKKYKKWLGILFFALLLCCFWKSVQNLQVLENSHVKMILYEENQSAYTGAYAAEVLKKNAEQENPVNATFWGNQGKDRITGTDLGRSQSCEILAVCGNTQNLYPSAPALFTGEEENCLISEGTAYELFGDTDVRGLSVNYQGKTFTVRGVIAQKQPLFVYETSSESVSGLYHVIVDQEHTIGLTEPDQVFMSRYGEGISYDISFLEHCLKGFIGILILVVLIYYERQIIVWFRQEKGIYRLILAAVGIGTAVLSSVLFGTAFELSFSGLPAVWSDFNAWQELAQTWNERRITFLTQGVETFLYPYWIAFFLGILWSIGSLGCLYFIRKCIKR